MKPLLKLVISIMAAFCILVVIPAYFSFSVMNHHIQKSHLCFVTMPSTPVHKYLRLEIYEEMPNCYEKISGNKTTPCRFETVKDELNEAHAFGIYAPYENKVFHQIYSYNYPSTQLSISRLFRAKDPSSASIAMSLQETFRMAKLKNKSSLNRLYHNIDQWCFEYYSTSLQTVCTQHESNHSDIHQGIFPLFTIDNAHFGLVYIQFPVNIFHDKSAHSWLRSWNIFHSSELIGNTGIKRNPKHSNSRESSPFNIQYNSFFQHPTTIILLITNMSLAFLFYYKNIQPEEVSCSYATIIDQREYWRCFSGSLAHFEPWHLLFNMSSLYTLGTSLESDFQFSSIPFLLTSISLMFWTPMVEMTLIYLRIRLMHQNQRDVGSAVSDIKLQRSVGFSGVLFAWMVLDSLERDQTCPIPFFPEICFPTKNFASGWIKFNVGPFVSLFVCQFLIPRASFIGHLSGILCGFVYHWKILPTTLAWSPEVLIPLCLVSDYLFVRKLFSFRNGFRSDGYHTSDTVYHEEVFQTNQSTLKFFIVVMTAFCCASLTCFRILGTLCLSQIIVIVLFCIVYDAHRKIHVFHSPTNTATAETVYQGLVVSLAISIASTALAVGSVLGTWTHFATEYCAACGPVLSQLVLMCLVLVHFMALLLVSGIFVDQLELKSNLFSFLFGWISTNAHDTLALIHSKVLRHEMSIHRR